jgi:hypothetical protein
MSATPQTRKNRTGIASTASNDVVPATRFVLFTNYSLRELNFQSRPEPRGFPLRADTQRLQDASECFCACLAAIISIDTTLLIL